LGTNVSEENTASIFIVEVNKVGAGAGCIGVEGRKLVTDDMSFLLTSGTRNRVCKHKRDVYIVTSTNTV
jgi:hypothetical protein